MKDPCNECLLKVNCNQVCREKHKYINWAMNEILNGEPERELVINVVSFLYEGIQKEEKGNRSYYE